MADYIFHHDPPSVADPAASEAQIQGQCISRICNYGPGIAYFAVPNAGRRTAWEAMQRKREGMVAGVVDLVVVWPKCVGFAEIKPRDGRLDEDQIKFLNKMHRLGHPCGCFRSADTFHDWLIRIGAPIATRVAAA